MTSESLNIGIAGLGTVGVGVFKILSQKEDLLALRGGKKLNISAVSASNKSKDRGVDLSGISWHDNALELASNDDVDIVVELIGGADGVAYDLCKTALENGKHVVTANKALIATHGLELAGLAEKNNVALSFEAAVAGGIPILKSLREGLTANDCSRVSGILNGTCNYILTAMAKEKREFDEVLKEAQELGYAEADPTFDIEGIDAAHKLAIITGIVFGCNLKFDAVYTEGITNVSLNDVEYADELGYVIKLLGITNQTDAGEIEQRVCPCLVPKDAQISKVDWVLNAVFAESDFLGTAFFTGPGAGEGPTASAVVADIIDISADRIANPFGVKVADLKDKKFLDIDHHNGEYYIRLKVKDEPGVLALITTAFSEKNVGVGKMLQKTDSKTQTAQIAITTHDIDEVSINNALKNISEIEYILEKPHVIRIEQF